MWSCPSDKTLGQYYDGDLPGPAAARLGRHVAVCPRCRGVLERLGALEHAIRQGAEPPADAPDVAGRVTDDLGRRGAFFAARVAAGKRRMFGESLVSVRMLAAVAVAAGVVMLAAAGLDQMTRQRWARQTAPVLADAERVLVRLVYVEGTEESQRLAWARDETRKLDLPQRLGDARSGAQRVWAKDLAPLEATFALLARGDPLPPGLVAQLNDGQLLGRAVRLRESLAPGG